MLEKLSDLMDEWFDRLSWAALGVSIVAACFLVYTNHQEAAAVGVANPHASAPRFALSGGIQPQRPKELEDALAGARKLLEDEKFPEVVSTTENIIKQYPKESFAYVYLARAYTKQDQLEESLKHYRQAVELNPDLVDRKSPDRIGPELKLIVKKAVVKARTKEFKDRPDSKKVLKALYYLQRRLAGGCE